MDKNFDMQKAIRAAANGLGVDPKSLQNGQTDALLGKLTPQQRAALQSVLQDQAALQKLLASPQAQAVLKNFMYPNKG